MVYLITYDLCKEGQDYEALYKAIKEITPAWCRFMKSAWFVYTSKSDEQIRDCLLPVMDNNDLLFITKVSKQYKGWLTDDVWNWLKDRI